MSFYRFIKTVFNKETQVKPHWIALPGYGSREIQTVKMSGSNRPEYPYMRFAVTYLTDEEPRELWTLEYNYAKGDQTFGAGDRIDVTRIYEFALAPERQAKHYQGDARENWDDPTKQLTGSENK